MTAHTSASTGRTLNQVAGMAAGAIFLAVGLLGFTVSGGHHVAGAEGGNLLGLFQVNVLHNLVHLAVGAALLGAALASAKISRLVNTLIGAVYLVVGAAGLFIIGTSANIIALNGWDNGLHLVAGIALLALGTFGDRTRG